MAKEWGVSQDSDGYANKYQIDTSGLTILDLNNSGYTILHWLSVLLENRVFDITSALAQDFINGAISVRQLGNAMKLGNLGTQFVLKSQKAFDAIKFTGYEVAESAEWFAKKELRDKSVRRQYFDVEKNRSQRGDLYIVQILDEEIKADDSRLR